MIGKKTYIFIACWFLFTGVSGQRKITNISLGIHTDYSVNFWEDIEDYQRENGSKNIGNYLSASLKLKKIGIHLKYGIQGQHYFDMMPDDPASPPWVIFKREHVASFNYGSFGLSYVLWNHSKWAISTGLEVGQSKVTKATMDWEAKNGKTKKADLDLQDLQNRLSLRNYIEVERKIKRFSVSAQVGQQSILKGLNSKQVPPYTVLDKNSKSAIFLGCSLKYNFIKVAKI